MSTSPTTSTGQTGQSTIGERIRQLQETMQQETTAAIGSHAEKLAILVEQARELAAIEVFPKTVRESLNRFATNAESELVVISRAMANYGNYPAAVELAVERAA